MKYQHEWRRILLPDYKTMYYQLAAKVADAVELLISAQQEGESQFAGQNEHSKLVLLHNKVQEEPKDEDSNQ